jgi:hypothetical protein
MSKENQVRRSLVPIPIPAPTGDSAKVGIDFADDLGDFALTLPVDRELHTADRLTGGKQFPLVICRQRNRQVSRLSHSESGPRGVDPPKRSTADELSSQEAR